MLASDLSGHGVYTWLTGRHECKPFIHIKIGKPFNEKKKGYMAVTRANPAPP